MMTERSSFNKVIIDRGLRIVVPVEKCTVIKPVVIAFLFAVKVINRGLCFRDLFFGDFGGIFFFHRLILCFSVSICGLGRKSGFIGASTKENIWHGPGISRPSGNIHLPRILKRRMSL